ncbi:MAG: dihydropteroate synthase [Rickettsiales bacterium]|nr:dihydropteroate synthase [Rickettsiales bacterium]
MKLALIFVIRDSRLMTKLMAIINITPDSFSDGGANFAPDKALAAIKQALIDGAKIIDIGAESTRPGAACVSAEEEWGRLEPVLKKLDSYRRPEIAFSIDTRHATTAKKALGHGIDWINDVSGFSSDDMVQVAAESDCKLVVMHSLSVPADRTQHLPEDGDVIEALTHFADERFATLARAGINADRLIFDPGIGFGKTAAQSLQILDQIQRLHSLDVPILVGHSRKSCLKELGDPDEATLRVSKQLVACGVDYIRVHDVKAHAAFLRAS